MSHYANVDLSEYGPNYRYECDEPDGANCRLEGAPGCDCESWSIKRDENGRPYHDVTDEAGAFIEQHEMRPVDYCNVVTWLSESDSPFGGQEIRLRIVPMWDGDLYVVEDFEVIDPTPAPS